MGQVAAEGRQVTLTVPGKYDKEFLSLYTVIEQVDSNWDFLTGQHLQRTIWIAVRRLAQP